MRELSVSRSLRARAALENRNRVPHVATRDASFETRLVTRERRRGEECANEGASRIIRGVHAWAARVYRLAGGTPPRVSTARPSAVGGVRSPHRILRPDAARCGGREFAESARSMDAGPFFSSRDADPSSARGVGSDPREFSHNMERCCECPDIITHY